MPHQDSSFSYTAVLLFLHISFLYTHTSAFCHIIYQAKQCLPLLLHHLSRVPTSSKHKNPEINQELSNLPSPTPKGSSPSFTQYFKGRLAKSQTSVAPSPTVPHVPHRRDTEMSPSSWDSNCNDSDQRNDKHSLLKAVTCGNLTCFPKIKQRPKTFSNSICKISLVLQIAAIYVFIFMFVQALLLAFSSKDLYLSHNSVDSSVADGLKVHQA